MSHESVICIANTPEQADRIVRQLKDVGFTHDDISVLFPDKETTHAFAHEKNTKAPVGAVTGASTGGVVGGVLGWIVGIGALAIPELEAKRYEGRLQAGNILISVHTENTAEIESVEAIYEQAGAEDICTTGESNNPKIPRTDIGYDEPALTTAPL